MDKQQLQQYMQVIYRRCYRILKEEELAWDALQDIFASFCEANQNQTIKEPLRYLYRTCTNHCFNLLKYQKKRVMLSFDERNFDGQFKHSVESLFFCDEILQEFGEEALALLIYRHVDQLTYGELASIYGLTDRGIKKKIERITKQIQVFYESPAQQKKQTKPEHRRSL